MGCDYLLLPPAESDPTSMLWAGTMLREGTKPVLPVAVDLQAADPLGTPGRMPANGLDRPLAPFDDQGLPLIEDDAQAPNPPRG